MVWCKDTSRLILGMTTCEVQPKAGDVLLRISARDMVWTYQYHTFGSIFDKIAGRPDVVLFAKSLDLRCQQSLKCLPIFRIQSVLT